MAGWFSAATNYSANRQKHRTFIGELIAMKTDGAFLGQRVLAACGATILILCSCSSAETADTRREGLHQRKDEKTVAGWMQDVRQGSATQQLTALDCLGDYGQEAVTAMPLIRERLKAEDALIRRQALASLVRIYEGDFKCNQTAGEQDGIAQMDRKPLKAAYTLSKLATAKSLQTVSGALSNDDLVVQCFALKAVWRIFWSARYSGDKQERSVAPAELAAVWREQGKVCLEPMIRLLSSGNQWLQENAAETIAEMTGNDIDIVSAAVPVLIDRLKNADSRLTFHIAWAIYRIGKPAAAAAPVLVEAFNRAEKSNDELARWGLEAHEPAWAIVRALGSLGPAAREVALPSVRLLCKHPNATVREDALRSLLALGALPESIDELVIALRDAEPKVRIFAAYALRNSGKDGSKVVPALIKALEDTDKVVRFGAACSIRELAKYAADARPALKKLAADDDLSVRIAAEQALQAIQREHPE